jgi:hypothetical protein
LLRHVRAVWRQALNAWTSNPYSPAIGSYLIIFTCAALACGAPALMHQVRPAPRAAPPAPAEAARPR